MGQFLSSFSSPMTMFPLSPTEASPPPKKMKRVRFESAQQRRVTRSSVIIPESPDPSFKTDSPYCSRSLREVLTPYDSAKANVTIPSQIAEYDCESQIDISQVATTLQTNTSRTISGLDQVNYFGPSHDSMIPEVSQRNAFCTQFTSQDMSLETTVNKDDMTPSQLKNSEVLSSPHLFSETSSKDDMDHLQIDFKEYNVTPATPVTNIYNNTARRKIQFNKITETCSDVDPSEQNEYEYVHMDDQNFYEPDERRWETPIRSTGSFLRTLQVTTQRTPLNPDQQFPVICSTPLRRTADYLYTQNSFQEIYQTKDCSALSLDVIPSDSIQNLPSLVTNVSVPSHIMVTPRPEIKFAPSGFHRSNSTENHHEEMNCSQNCSKVSDDGNLCISLSLGSQDSSQCALPPNVLLSNYCSEYNRSYISKDLKPNLQRNYCSDKPINPLMKDLNTIIPKNKTLQEFFEAPDKSFEEVAANVQNEVQNLLNILDSDESN